MYSYLLQEYCLIKVPTRPADVSTFDITASNQITPCLELLFNMPAFGGGLCSLALAASKCMVEGEMH